MHQNNHNKGKFAQGEKCYVPFADGNYYEAKILKTQQQSDGWFYLVHYMGWNKKWDEWIEEAGIIKQEVYAELKQKKEIVCQQQQQQDQSQPNVSGLSGSSEGEGGTTPGSTKRNGSNDSSKAASRNGSSSNKKRKLSSGSQEQVMMLDIPMNLKKQLVEMFEQVKLRNMLIPLPRHPNVNDILNEFLKEIIKPEEGQFASDADREIVNGIRLYFDQSLALVLLYNNERELHQQFCPKTLPSQVYGAEHFLRLFVKFSDLLDAANLKEEELYVIQSRVQSLLTFINNNQQRFFLPQEAYQSMSSDLGCDAQQ